jgi:starch synthase
VRILFASSEVYPFSKTGGLGDVLGALPAALSTLGHEILVVTPWYNGLRGSTPLWIGDIDIPFDGGWESVGVGTLEVGPVRLAFVGHDDFRRDGIYGHADDVRRFCRLTRAVPQVAARLGFTPDVVHVQDWHTAYLPMVLESGEHLPEGFAGTPSVLTIHNAQYQGVSDIASTLGWLRVPGEMATPWMEHHGKANALRAGCGFAGRITTVSPNYAAEIVSPEFGYGLEGTFQAISHKLVGIVNGIDTNVWDPATDPHLPRPFSVDDMSGKAASKLALCRGAGLDPERPLMGVVSRLVEQKGIDVLLDAAPTLREQGWSLVVLGTGDPRLEARVRDLARESVTVWAELEYDESFAHLVYAGSDALCVPSRFEPCGLSQLIAMRYGTLPIARATGGLRDTIRHGRTGFLFSRLEADDLAAATSQAKRCYGGSTWSAMTRSAMNENFSWERSAQRYEELYRELGGQS